MGVFEKNKKFDVIAWLKQLRKTPASPAVYTHDVLEVPFADVRYVVEGEDFFEIRRK